MIPEIKHQGKDSRAGISCFREPLRHRLREQDKWAGQVRGDFRVLL